MEQKKLARRALDSSAAIVRAGASTLRNGFERMPNLVERRHSMQPSGNGRGLAKEAHDRPCSSSAS